ncbi:MAG: hydrogenase [Rhodospirillales bacterium]
MIRRLRSLLDAPLTEPAPPPDGAALAELAGRVDAAARQRLGRSLCIREVDAGSCNGCELEIHALNNAFYDIERFGIRFVASPQHADVLLVLGRSPQHARGAGAHLRCDAVAKWVVAVGDCAVDGGLFAGSYAVEAASHPSSVDLHIRGCRPPRRSCWPACWPCWSRPGNPPPAGKGG